MDIFNFDLQEDSEDYIETPQDIENRKIFEARLHKWLRMGLPDTVIEYDSNIHTHSQEQHEKLKTLITTGKAAYGECILDHMFNKLTDMPLPGRISNNHFIRDMQEILEIQNDVILIADGNMFRFKYNSDAVNICKERGSSRGFFNRETVAWGFNDAEAMTGCGLKLIRHFNSVEKKDVYIFNMQSFSLTKHQNNK